MSIPHELGPVRVFSPLGQGGMGAVYAGFDKDAKEFVAVKTLFQELNDDEVAVTLFEHECKLSKLLDHTNVVRFFQFGEEQETRYLALEYVRGTTISDLLETKGAMNPAQVVEILEDAAAALKHVHEKGIIHRDVKPENLIINQDGILKLIDFGIGILDYDDPLGDEGMVIGTCTYAAPEQNQGQDIGPGADLYALGAVAWHALTGRRWAQGSSPFEIGLQQMATDPEPPSSVMATPVPPELDRIVLRLMHKDPLERYRSADEVLGELRAFREAEEQKGLSDNIFADPLQGKWSVAKRSFYEKRYALSKSLARYIADRRPDFAPVHFLLGKLFALDTREFNSTDSFRRALELDPKNYEYMADFALSLYRLNMFSLATQELETLVGQAPDHPLGSGFKVLVDERLRADRAADDRRQAKEEKLSGADLAALDLEAMEEGGAGPAPNSDLPPIVPDPLPRTVPPQEVEEASGTFPGFGRLALGDTAGALQAAAPALLMVVLILACFFFPRTPAGGWDKTILKWISDNPEVEAEELAGQVRMIYYGIWGGKLFLASIFAGVLAWLWRRETRASYRAAVLKAYQGQVVLIQPDGQLLTNIGAERGAHADLVLEVYRVVGGTGGHFPLGRIKLQTIEEDASLGEFRAGVGVTEAPAPGDRVRVPGNFFETREGPRPEEFEEAW